MKMELHVHTRYSKDSFLCFWPLYLTCLLKHISIIAITEHDNITGGVKFSEFCKKHGNRVNVIVGEEIFTSQGELIGLFLNHSIAQGFSAKETIGQIKEQGGVVYVPHPYDLKRYRTVLQECAIEENRDLIDCIEVHNGRNVSSDFDVQQLFLAQKYGLRPVVGSDAHTWMEIGRNYIDIEKIPESRDEFVAAIKEAKFVSARCMPMAHMITRVVKLLKLLAGGKWNEIYKLVIRKVKRNQH